MILTQDEVLQSNEIYSYLHPILEKFSKNSSGFSQLQREIKFCFDKNSSALQTNIIGKSLLVNKRTEDNIFQILGVDLNKLKDAFKNSEYFKSFGKLNLEEQLLFSFPLIVLSGEYLKIRKEEQAKFVYFFAFFKPYASIISKYFPYKVNEDRMRWTIENALTDKSDIRKMENLSNMLLKKSINSLENYSEDLKGQVITDRSLHVIFTSGIQSRINNTIKEIAAKYLENKNKYLPFENTSFSGEDEDSGSVETFDKEIQSDSAIKLAISRRAASRLNSGQIDMAAIQAACKLAWGVSTPKYNLMLKNIILSVIEKDSQKLPEFFECLVGSILFHINPETGMKYTARDLLSPVFIVAARKIFVKKNIKDANTLRTKELINELLNDCYDEFLISGNTKKNQLRDALYTYLVLICRKGE